MNLKRVAAAAAVGMIALGGLTACDTGSCTQAAIDIPEKGGGGGGGHAGGGSAGHGGGEAGTGAHGSGEEGTGAGSGSRGGSSVPFFAHSGTQCTTPTAKP